MNKENLYKAIELAQGQGVCRYVDDAKPCCVIAQLIHLEKGDISLINKEHNDISISHLMRKNDHVRQTLSGYPLDLLIDLQDIWDSVTVNDPKLAMRECVDGF